jgi:hypothetical protein
VAINCFGFELCRPQDCFHCRQSNHFGTKMWTEEWLRRYQQNPKSMTALRTLAGECGHGGIGRFSDDGVIRVIASEIRCGRLLVCDNAESWPEAGDSATVGGADQGDSKPFPLSQRQSRPSSDKQERPDPPTLSDNVDGNSQAAALTSASSSGAPFCAECEKHKREMAAAAAGGQQ